jgi:small neutral amino acid transporter SnatA (MarC family)
MAKSGIWRKDSMTSKMTKSGKWMVDMVFHACIAAFFLEIAIVFLANYVVNIMEPTVRANMEAFDIAGNMLLTIAALTAFAYNAYMSLHRFLLWHNYWKDLRNVLDG